MIDSERALLTVALAHIMFMKGKTLLLLVIEYLTSKFDFIYFE